MFYQHRQFATLQQGISRHDGRPYAQDTIEDDREQYAVRKGNQYPVACSDILLAKEADDLASEIIDLSIAQPISPIMQELLAAMLANGLVEHAKQPVRSEERRVGKEGESTGRSRG